MTYDMNKLGKTIATLLLTIVSLTAWGGEVGDVTIDPNLENGSISKEVNGSTVTLTAQPDEGYFLCFDDLSVTAYTEGGNAQARRRAGGSGSDQSLPFYSINVTNNQNGTYTFTLPEEGHNVFVTAIFRKVTVTLPELSEDKLMFWTGNKLTPAVNVAFNTNVTLSSTTDYTIAYSNNIDPGEATVTVTGTGKYTGTAKTTFQISKEILIITANSHSISYGSQPDNNGVKYEGFTDGDDETVLNGELIYKYNKEEDGSGEPYSTTSEVGTTWYIIPSGLTSTKYQITFKPGTLTVTRRTNAITKHPEPLDLTYNTEEQELVTKGQSRGGKWLYSLDNKNWSNSVPKGLNAGTYTVYYKVNASDTYGSVKGSSVEVTIKPKVVTDPQIVLSQTEYNYDRTAKQPEVKEVWDEGVLVASTEYSVGYQNNVNAGDNKAVVTISDNEGGNYIISGSTNFSINKADLNVWADYKEKTFRDADPLLTYTYSGLASGDKIDGKLVRDSGEDAGSYSINQGSLSASDNYTLLFSSATLTINPKNLTVGKDGKAEVDPERLTYNGKDQKPKLTVWDGKEQVKESEYRISYQQDGKPVKETKNVGTYTVVFEDNSGGNYIIDGTTTYVIDPKTVGLEWTDTDVDYDGQPHTPKAKAMGVEDGDECNVSVKGTQTAIGNYEAEATELSNKNYQLPDDVTCPWSIARRLDGLFADGNEWASFVPQEDLTVPEGLVAYVVTAVRGTTLIVQQVNYLPAGVGLLLMRADKSKNSFRGYAYSVRAAKPTSLLTGNATSATDIQIYTDYVLYNDQMVLAGVSSVGAGRAYLPKSAVGDAQVRSLSILVNGEATTVSSVDFDAVEAMDDWYTVGGRKLKGKPTKKGFYLNAGRKVVIK